MSMAKKVLIMAPSVSTIEQFNMDNIQILQCLGYEVHIAANFELGSSLNSKKINKFLLELDKKGVFTHHIPFVRRSLCKNYSAIRQYQKLVEKEMYTLIHCHTETGGLLTRLATPKKYHKNTKIIYTPHGFSFYKGASLKCWFVYYPIEKWLSSYMDEMISINSEDYKIAKKMCAKKSEYIAGIGVNTQRFSQVVTEREVKRKELGVANTAIMLLSVGELYEWKNHETVIQAVAKLDKPNVYYVICGRGPLDNYLRKLSQQLGIENRVVLTGFRNDIPEICKVADIFVFPSYHEGLPVALMEAMAAGLPCVVSKVRGNVDLIQDGKGGYLLEPNDIDGFAKAIEKLASDPALCKQMAGTNIIQVKPFAIERVHFGMERIYIDAMQEG